MTMQMTKEAMDALRNGISKYERLGDGGVLRGHMLEILDRCTVIEPEKVIAWRIRSNAEVGTWREGSPDDLEKKAVLERPYYRIELLKHAAAHVEEAE